MNETKKSRTPMKVPSKQALKDRIARLESENNGQDATINNLWEQRHQMHQAVMDALQANKYAFVSAEMLSMVAHKVGKIIRGEEE